MGSILRVPVWASGVSRWWALFFGHSAIFYKLLQYLRAQAARINRPADSKRELERMREQEREWEREREREREHFRERKRAGNTGAGEGPVVLK